MPVWAWIMVAAAHATTDEPERRVMTATHLWTFPDTVGRLDLTGFDVEAADGSLGKVDEATYEVGESYIVVDTGLWIFGKKVLLPAGTVKGVDRHEEKVYVDRSRDEIKDAPEFDKDDYQDEAYRDRVGDYYAGNGQAGARAEEKEAEPAGRRS